MAISVKKITLWRGTVEHLPGILAGTLKPLADAGGDPQVTMVYRHANDPSKATIEIYPITGRKLTAAARSMGLEPGGQPALLVEGEDRPGLDYDLAHAVAQKAVNITFLVSQVYGKKFSAVFGFATELDAQTASAVLRKASAPKPKKTAKRK